MTTETPLEPQYDYRKEYAFRDENMDMDIEIWINNTDIIDGKKGNMIMIMINETSETEIIYDFLHYMAYYGILEVVKWLVEYGESVSKIGKISYDQYTNNPYAFESKSPLHIAMQYSNYEVVKYLVENNADVNLKDKNQCTPLHYAASSTKNNESFYIVKFLVDRGAKLNIVDKNDSTPFLYALWANNIEIAKYLLGNGTFLYINRHHYMKVIDSINTSIIKIERKIQRHNIEEDNNLLREYKLLYTIIQEGWSPFQIIVGCHSIKNTKLALKNGRVDPRHGSRSIKDLFQISPKWNELLFEDQQKKELIGQAMGYWTPTRHFLFNLMVRKHIYCILLTEVRVRNQCKYEMPKEMWYKIFSFFLRTDWVINQ